MLGPEGVFKYKEQYNPRITEKVPPIIENITIFVGLLLKFLDIAGGIKSKPVISKTPIILIDIAIIPAKRIVKI